MKKKKKYSYSKARAIGSSGSCVDYERKRNGKAQSGYRMIGMRKIRWE